ncbi:LodA/GoxA family CTQ-dependent oxidase [Undibacterium sp. TJN19]|uniref:LodA/GoxA family CTQ-dependent oxidase n=1 Tax=Undibacterium sp. TJN19 TaxID=3413055 RepID=UPI003BEF6383
MSKETDPIPKCYDQASQAPERLTEMFVGIAQENRIKLGQRPAERAVFRKLHGVASARLVMEKKIPKELKVGVFSHDSLQAWVRFSSDTTPTSPDLASTVGIGIKLFGVPGPKALGDDGDTADFIMQNFPIFFVDNAKEMVEFTYAGVVAGDYPGYLKKHPKTAKILDQMEKVEGSVLTTTYWAILPFKAGEKHYVKYRLEPVTPPENVPNDENDYLAVDMCNRLAKREYQFRFMVQLRTNPKTMPLDEATVEWPEKESPFVHVATLILPQQDVSVRGQSEYGQGLAFNIWRVPPVQAPVGSIAEARKVVYAAGARARHEANGQGTQDPSEPRTPPAACPFHAVSAAKTEAESTPVKDTCIVKAVIYPAIGVARVGTSKDEWFLGPEVPYPKAEAPGYYRDAEKKLKRQGAKFRLYGVNAKGDIVKELNAGNAKVEWQVQLANTKSAWYGFQLALDIPEAASAPQTTLRNAAVPDRSQLSITPKARKIAGKKSRPHRFDDGKFMGKNVYLGEAFSDENGHLIVLGGHGVSFSYDNSRAITFANNEGWCDDTSDGPINASVVYEGQPLLVEPAWVVVAPPNYAPQRKSVRTMWDLMRDVAITAGWLPKPTRPSFTFDILPLFERLNGLQWVNAGFNAGFGWKGAIDLTTPDVLSRLSSTATAYVELRRTIANQFRNYKVDAWSPKPWPWLYGDAMAIPAAQTPRQNASLTGTQLAMLAEWAEGNFVEDYDAQRRHPASIDEVPLEQQGDTLTQAALEFCLADAFHPGCEMTWPVRTSTMYMAPFRFAHALDGWVAPGLGEILTSDGVTIPNGPLYGQQAGGITRWMAVPWQTDTASCRSGYDKAYDPYVPSFWPARVPNQVITKQNYEVVMDGSKPLGERLAAFANRAAWINPLGTTSYTDQINNMIHHFDHLGVVEVHPGPPDHDNFPREIEVEDQHVPIKDMPNPNAQHNQHDQHDQQHVRVGAAITESADSLDLMTIEKVRRFPRGLHR